MGRRPIETGPARPADTANSDNVEKPMEAEAEAKLLPGWKSVYTEDSAEVYYWNEITNEVSWDAPLEPPTTSDAASIHEFTADYDAAIADIKGSQEQPADTAKAAWNHLRDLLHSGRGDSRLAAFLECRLLDWKAGGLSDEFLSTRLVEMAEAAHASSPTLSESPRSTAPEEKVVEKDDVVPESSSAAAASTDGVAPFSSHTATEEAAESGAIEGVESTAPAPTVSMEKSSILIYSSTGVPFSGMQLAHEFSGNGKLEVRILGDSYYMVSFTSDAHAQNGVHKVATEADAVNAAAAGWVTSRLGYYLRFVQLSDLKQPLFDLPAESFTASSGVVERAAVISTTKRKANTSEAALIQKWKSARP
jgi:hypothetical protein